MGSRAEYFGHEHDPARNPEEVISQFAAEYFPEIAITCRNKDPLFYLNTFREAITQDISRNTPLRGHDGHKYYEMTHTTPGMGSWFYYYDKTKYLFIQGDGLEIIFPVDPNEDLRITELGESKDISYTANQVALSDYHKKIRLFRFMQKAAQAYKNALSLDLGKPQILENYINQNLLDIPNYSVASLNLDDGINLETGTRVLSEIARSGYGALESLQASGFWNKVSLTGDVFAAFLMSQGTHSEEEEGGYRVDTWSIEDQEQSTTLSYFTDPGGNGCVRFTRSIWSKKEVTIEIPTTGSEAQYSYSIRFKGRVKGIKTSSGNGLYSSPFSDQYFREFQQAARCAIEPMLDFN